MWDKMFKFQQFLVIDLICKKTEIIPDEYDVNEIIVNKTILLLDKDTEILILSF